MHNHSHNKRIYVQRDNRNSLLTSPSQKSPPITLPLTQTAQFECLHSHFTATLQPYTVKAMNSTCITIKHIIEYQTLESSNKLGIRHHAPDFHAMDL